MCELEVYQPVNGKLTCAQFEANFAALAELVARYQIVEELPETIEPCRQVLYNGTMWRGLLEGESSLPAGTPWPVKGYKELSGWFYWDGANVVQNFFVNEVDEDLEVNRINQGIYDFSDPNGFFTGKLQQTNVFVNNGGLEDQSNYAGNVDFNELAYPNILFTNNLGGSFYDAISMYQRFNFKVLIFPPQP